MENFSSRLEEEDEAAKEEEEEEEEGQNLYYDFHR